MTHISATLSRSRPHIIVVADDLTAIESEVARTSGEQGRCGYAQAIRAAGHPEELGRPGSTATWDSARVRMEKKIRVWRTQMKPTAGDHERGDNPPTRKSSMESHADT